MAPHMRCLCAGTNAAATSHSLVLYLLGQQAPLHMADSFAQAPLQSRAGIHWCDLAECRLLNLRMWLTNSTTSEQPATQCESVLQVAAGSAVAQAQLTAVMAV